MIYRLKVHSFLGRDNPDLVRSLSKKILSYALLREEGIDYEKEALVRNFWGKPMLKDYPHIHYNISHCENYVACVTSSQYEVGIDVERVRDFNEFAARRACSQEELERIYSKEDPNREFFRYWTLKESYIKAIGRGLAFPMKKVIFNINNDGEIVTDLPDCRFILLEDEKKFITAVCYMNIY
jgi:4'-phosphopantetheinyl transferase